MKLLLSNDDGVHAPGLRALAETLADIADIKVVAPDRDRSGASNSLTLARPLTLVATPEGFIAVDGTPTDCVHLGQSRLIGFQPQRVIAGINSHANLGDDVLYSGTVAAAMEGRFLDLPAMAVSLVNNGNNHFGSAAKIIKKILLGVALPLLTRRTVLNINVPDLPYSDIKGLCITRLGHRFKGGEPVQVKDPRGRTRYWIAAAGDVDDAGDGTDFFAVKNGFVSITPINVDMTIQNDAALLQRWVGKPMTYDLQGIGMTSRRTRMRLIDQLQQQGISEAKVIDALKNVPRHIFVDEALAHRAYENTALPIGNNQTISQPYIVARMTELMFGERPLKKVLEIGTGSGYQAAILAHIAEQVFTVERIEPLLDKARHRFRALKLHNIMSKLADGHWGWPEQAVFDAIMVTAAPDQIPAELMNQLSDGGKMVVPAGSQGRQELYVLTKTGDSFVTEAVEAVRFVPLLEGTVR